MGVLAAPMAMLNSAMLMDPPEASDGEKTTGFGPEETLMLDDPAPAVICAALTVGIWLSTEDGIVKLPLPAVV